MPTPILIEGFEHQVISQNSFSGASAGLVEGVSGTPTFPAGRNGVCLQCASSASVVSMTKRIADPTIAVVSYYYKLVSGGGGTAFFASTSAFSSCARLYLEGGGSNKLGLQVGGAGPTYEGPDFNDHAWHRIDMKIDVSANPWTVTWQIDGTAMTTVQWATTADVVRYLKFGIDATGTRTDNYDDLVVSATAGDYPLGAHDVLYGVPNGDGTHNAGTNTIENQSGTDITSPNAFPLLDELPPTTTDYIQQATIGGSNYAEVTFPDQPGSITIWGVEGVASLFASGLNQNHGITRILDGSSNTLTDIYDGDMSETALHYRRAIITAPGGGWDAGYAGVKARVGFSTDVTDVPRWAALMLQYAVTSTSGAVNITTTTVQATASVFTPTVSASSGGALAPVVATQYNDQGDNTVYTTGSLTPQAGALYIAFARCRTPGVAYRTPTLVGTNGWNVTWTRVAAAQAVYRFTGIDRGGHDVFWGVAASAVAGTLTFDYGAGSAMTAGTLHLIRVDGGPDTVSPIGATASAHEDTAAVASLNATLSAMPASTSLILACCSSDLNTGSMTPSTGYATLGTMQVGGSAGISQPMYDEGPTSTTVGTTFSGADIIAISAVEVRKAGASAAFPVVAAVNYSEETVDTTTHDVLLPAGISAGNRLMLFSVWDGTATQSGMPTGWTKILGINFVGGLSGAVWEKINASGTETNFTYTTSAAERSVNRTWRITGSHASQPSETGVDIAGTASSINPDDPNPSWGAADTLWAIFAGIDSAINVSAYPANYTSNQFQDDSGGTTAGAGIALCSRNLNATVDTAGAMTLSATSTYFIYQIAIRPAVAGPPIPKIQRVRIVKSAAVQNRASRW